MIARLIMGAERHVTCRSCINASSSSILHRSIHFTEYVPELARSILYLRSALRYERTLPAPRNNYMKKDHLVKILCPSVVTEQMLEYGNVWLKQIVRYSGAKIEISLDGEFFPLTEDRVIAISGSYECISKAVEVIVQDLLKPPHNPMTRGRYPQPVEIPQHIRLLIPLACCDSVVGPGGAHMIEITGRSRCDVHLVPYDEASQSHEIIITINTLRDAHSFIHAAQLIVWRILFDSDAFPYVIKGLSYGNGRYEREKYVRPDVGVLSPLDPAKKLDPFLQKLIQFKKNKVKKIYNVNKKPEAESLKIDPQ